LSGKVLYQERDGLALEAVGGIAYKTDARMTLLRDVVVAAVAVAVVAIVAAAAVGRRGCRGRRLIPSCLCARQQ